MGYSASNSTALIRRVRGAHDGFTLADNAAVLNLVRDQSANAAFAIADAIRDGGGHLIETIDARGISTKYDFDSLGRQIRQRNAVGTAIETKSETSYDVTIQPVEIAVG